MSLSPARVSATDLATLDEMEQDALDAIENVTEPDQAEQLLARVKAVHEAQRLARLGADYEKRWSSVRLRAERKYGELLGPPQTGRPEGNVSATNVSSGAERVAAHAARQVAAVPDEVFEEFLKTEDEPTRAGLLKAKRATDNVARVRKAADKRAQKVAQDDAAARGQCTLHHGSYDAHVAELERSSVKLVLTDPPYGAAYKSGYRVVSDHEAIAGDHDPTHAVGLASQAVEAIIPALTEDAHVLVFCRWKEEPLLRDALSSIADLELRGSLVWVKNATGMGDLKRTFAPAHERILHLARPAALMRIREGDVLQASRVVSEDHPTEKPIDLLAALVRAVTEPGDLVVDPFAGTASTIEAACRAGRNGWGCEINGEYAIRAQERLDAIA